MKSTVFLSIVALSGFLDCGVDPGTKVASSLINAFTLSRRSFSLLFRLALKKQEHEKKRYRFNSVRADVRLIQYEK